MNKEAIALLSGGIDSSLALKLMIDQGIEVAGEQLTSPFCSGTPKIAGCKHHAHLISGEVIAMAPGFQGGIGGSGCTGDAVTRGTTKNEVSFQ
ncbi:MAG TPA: hypothetical protein ENN34_04090 [Deltaproteobacteria bacterium]|nr:hypothetical protein [Deltaproteobacteria bacterium]